MVKALGLNSTLITRGTVMSRLTRKGFTLVEMLVVLSIVVVVSVIIIPFIARSNDKDIVPRGARFLQGALMQARSRAQLERTANGIRLLPTNVMDYPPTNTRLAWSEQFEYIHDPGDFVGNIVANGVSLDWVQGPLPDAAVGNVPVDYRGRVVGGTTNPVLVFNNNPSNPNLGEPVKPGDYIEFLGNGQIFQVLGFPGCGGLPALAAPPAPYNTPGTTMYLSRVMNFSVSQPALCNFRIIRRPRPVPGERPLEMPRGVVVDLTLPFNATNPQPNGPFSFALSRADRDLPGAPAGQGDVIWMRGISTPFGSNGNPVFGNPIGSNSVEIMFSPSGQVVGDAAAADILYLWLHPSGEPNNWLIGNPGASLGDAGNQSLVVIYTRNGTTSSYPVNQGTQGNPADPYGFAKSARAQNVGGL
jgi:prepilin-type N-terminal cleavage/methylation domain-containing protein